MESIVVAVVVATAAVVAVVVVAVVVVAVVAVVTITTTTITITRKWYKPCPTTGVNVGWVCTSVEAYQRYHSRGGCFYPNNDQSAATIPPAPPERCLFVDDTCQFSDSTLQCAFHQSWADGCQYRCVQVNGSSWTNGSENCRYIKYDVLLYIQKKSGLTKYPAIYD